MRADAGGQGARDDGRRAPRRNRESRDGSGCRRACRPARVLLDIAREHALRRRQAPFPDASAWSAWTCAKLRLSAGTASRSSSFAGRARDKGLAKQMPTRRTTSAVVVEHRLHARRIGLPQRPGLLPGEIAVGFRHHAEDRRERQMDRLLAPSPCAPAPSAAAAWSRIAPSASVQRRHASAPRRRSSWRSSTASAAPDCRGRWRGRHWCG